MIVTIAKVANWLLIAWAAIEFCIGLTAHAVSGAGSGYARTDPSGFVPVALLALAIFNALVIAARAAAKDSGPAFLLTLMVPLPTLLIWLYLFAMRSAMLIPLGVALAVAATALSWAARYMRPRAKIQN